MIWLDEYSRWRYLVLHLATTRGANVVLACLDTRCISDLVKPSLLLHCLQSSCHSLRCSMLLSFRLVSSFLALVCSTQSLVNAAAISSNEKALTPRAEQIVCVSQVLITTVYILVPIHIDLYVAQNTTLRVHDYFTLHVDNAPTSISTVYTGTTSSLITQSQVQQNQYTT